jgi:hypothetical protein
MKNKIMKMLSMLMVLAMLVVMAGCANGDNTDTNSTPTTSVNSTVTNTDNQLNEETDEDIIFFQKGSHFVLNNKIAGDIIHTLFYMEDKVKTDSHEFLKRLDAVKKVEIDYTDYITEGNDKLYKTNIKYTDFTDKMFGYMTENYFESSIFNDGKYFAEKNGYLYFAKTNGTESNERVVSPFFMEEVGGRFRYKAALEKQIELEPDPEEGYQCEYEYRYILVDFIKCNDMYVVDSCSNIENEDVVFKGYDKLNDVTAAAIVGNYLDLEGASSGDSCGSISYFVDYNWDFEQNKTYKTKYETLVKTNVKYQDFVDGALRYMSEKCFNETIAKYSWFAEKDGYLYSISLGKTGYGFDVLDVVFEKELDGTYTYIAKCGFDEINCYGICYYRANIIEENGKYVIDSIEYVSKEQVSLKNYTAINDYIAKDIIENGINIKSELETTQWVILNHLLPTFERDDTTRTIKDGDTTFYDTNIKYSTFTKAVLPFVSEKYLNSIKRDGLKEINDNLYVAELDEWLCSVAVTDAVLKSDSDGKFEYSAKCYSASYETGCFCVNATIIKENGNYVLDSYEVVKN